MDARVRVACIQAEPVVLDREATIEKLERPAGEAAAAGLHSPDVLRLSVTPT
jgi:predicted amidohydrolase